MALIRFFFGLGILLLQACDHAKESVSDPLQVAPAMDVHTYAQAQKAKIKHLSLNIQVDFEEQIIFGTASFDIEKDPSAKEIIMDINGLEIDTIWLMGHHRHDVATFEVGEAKPFLGSPLHIQIDSNTEGVQIKYQTQPNADALQWLQPQQTAGKSHPFLFTQGQAILTRTWIPCQDGPGIRFTYDASVQVPSGLMAVMSAENPQMKSSNGLYTFRMSQPIPSYLMALAVGDISFASLGPRTGVYAEPSMLEASASEFADLEKMVVAAEELYGPYLWGRYDLIVLPPSFPFGGMENPRLTFATPTIIAGDRSLTSLVAHELAHSWSGNLVTNATWDDFWLNEGHTVYIERRIMESLYGKDYVDMLALLGFQDLEKTMIDLAPADTHLKLQLEGRDPDEGMTDIAYEKGYLLLRTLEEQVGREIFDQYLKTYFEDYQFRSISTAEWKAYLIKNLLAPQKVKIDIDSWLYNPKLPENHAVVRSEKFNRVNDRLREFVRIARLDPSNTRAWSTHEWLHFIRGLPTDLHITFYEKLDEVYKLSKSGNSEILAAWLELSIRNNYLKEHNLPVLESFLTEVGRRKFLMPLYRALLESDQFSIAEKIFNIAKDGYHSVSKNSIENLLLENKPAI